MLLAHHNTNVKYLYNMNFTSENKTSLAAKYGVSTKKFLQWLRKIGMAKPKHGGTLYTPDEVRTITEKLGEP